MEQAIQQQAMQARAYAIWEAEGRPSGRDFQNWLQAEAEIKTMAAAKPSKRKQTARRAATATRGRKST